MTIILVISIGSGIFIALFGSILFQEENPLPLAVSILKLKLSDQEFVQFSKTEKRSSYLSINTGNQQYDSVKEFMKSNGWEFEEQMGSGLIFIKNGIEAIVETRQFSNDFIIWDVQKAVLHTDL